MDQFAPLSSLVTVAAGQVHEQEFQLTLAGGPMPSP